MTADGKIALFQGGEVDEPPESLCSMLRELRSRHGLSQYDLAGQLNDAPGNSSITRENISRWERGKRIPGPYWRKWLCAVLDLPQQDVDLAAVVARHTRRA